MSRRACVLAGLVALAPLATPAEEVMFVEGLRGGLSSVPERAGWFRVAATSWNVDRANAALPLSLFVSLYAQAGTAPLMEAALTGSVFRKIVLEQVAMNDGSVRLLVRRTCETASVAKVAARSASQQPQGLEAVDFGLKCGSMSLEYFDYSEAGQPIQRGTAVLRIK